MEAAGGLKLKTLIPILGLFPLRRPPHLLPPVSPLSALFWIIDFSFQALLLGTDRQTHMHTYTHYILSRGVPSGKGQGDPDSGWRRRQRWEVCSVENTGSPSSWSLLYKQTSSEEACRVCKDFCVDRLRRVDIALLPPPLTLEERLSCPQAQRASFSLEQSPAWRSTSRIWSQVEPAHTPLSWMWDLHQGSVSWSRK